MAGFGAIGVMSLVLFFLAAGGRREIPAAA
jgi:hypothetical protein